MKNTVLAATAALTVFSAGTAVAQSNLYFNRPDLDALIGKSNENTGQFSPIGFRPAASSTAVDVRVGPGGWTIDSITVWNFLNDGSFLAIDSAYLFIQERTGDLPIGNPFTVAQVAVEVTTPFGSTQGSPVQVTASGLNLALDAGKYWIGLTPNNSTGAFLGNGGVIGREVKGLIDPTYSLNFPGGFAWIPDQFNSSVDLAMQITGVPTPGAAGALALGGLVATRRRR